MRGLRSGGHAQAVVLVAAVTVASGGWTPCVIKAGNSFQLLRLLREKSEHANRTNSYQRVGEDELICVECYRRSTCCMVFPRLLFICMCDLAKEESANDTGAVRMVK
jgi:hypothetical protein